MLFLNRNLFKTLLFLQFEIELPKNEPFKSSKINYVFKFLPLKENHNGDQIGRLK